MELPTWAVRKATSSDREEAAKAYKVGTAKINIRNDASVRSWMKDKGWKRSWLFLQESFIKQLFFSEENYRLALKDKVVEILIPKTMVTISEKRLNDIDQSYADRSFSYVVESLREMRRAVEAGVTIEVDGKELKSWNSWYTWAHARYHLLEEGSDEWIGDDQGIKRNL
jgi:hypothetical protein